MGRKILIVFILLVGLLGCSRPDANKTKFTLSLPTGINGSFASTLPNSVHLGHVVINISGAGMTPVVFNWDGHNGGAPPAEFSFELSQGTGRLVQVLEVFVDDSDQSMLFYYGDSTLDFNSAKITANIPITKINQATTISGQVMGRYYTSATEGPTGIVNTTYAPPGKPDMIIETSFIYDGWFSFMGMTGIDFTYRMANGTKIFGGPVNLSNAMFDPTESVFKLALPVSTSNNNGTIESNGAELYVWGWFGDPNIVDLSSKKVCKNSTAGFSGPSERGVYGNVATKLTYNQITNNASFPTVLELANTTSPLGTIPFIGGVSDSDSACTGNTYVNAFTVSNLNIKNGKEQAAPFRGPLMIKNLASNEALIGSSNIRQGTLLPNFAATQVVAYIYPDNQNTLAIKNQKSGFDCINPPASQAVVTANIDGNRNFDLDFTGYSANTSVGLCFKNGSFTYARGMFKYNGTYDNGGSSSGGSSSGGGGGTPTQLGIESNPAMGSGECKRVRIKKLNSNGFETSMGSAVSVNLTSSNGGVAFYPSNDFCTGSNINSISILDTMPSAEVNMRAASTGTFTITAASSGLTNGTKTIQIRSSGDFTDFKDEFNRLGNLSTCKEIKIRAFTTNSDPLGTYTGSALIKSTSSTLGTSFFSSLGCSSPITADANGYHPFSFNAGIASIFMRSTSTGIGGLDIKVIDGTLEFKQYLNYKVVSDTEPTQLLITGANLDSTYTPNKFVDYNTLDCIPYTLQVSTDNGTAITTNRTVDINLWAEGGNNLTFFSNSGCSTQHAQNVSNWSMTGGQMQLWFKANKTSNDGNNYMSFTPKVSISEAGGPMDTNLQLQTHLKHTLNLNWIAFKFNGNDYAYDTNKTLADGSCTPFSVGIYKVATGGDINSVSNTTGGNVRVTLSMPTSATDLQVYSTAGCPSIPAWNGAATPSTTLDVDIADGTHETILYLKNVGTGATFSSQIIYKSNIQNFNFAGSYSNAFTFDLQ